MRTVTLSATEDFRFRGFPRTFRALFAIFLGAMDVSRGVEEDGVGVEEGEEGAVAGGMAECRWRDAAVCAIAVCDFGRVCWRGRVG